MQQISNLVQELGVARLTNPVYVGTMKFTVDEVKKFINGSSFTADNPVPELLKKQFIDTRTAFQAVDEAYAVTMRSALTDQIAALDKEGDQLIYAVKGIVEAALRMAFDQERQSRAQYYSEFLRKYKVDPTENMISEWSKVQQMCQEADRNYQLELAEKELGITAAMDRLKVIADEIRQKISQRSSELPELQLMKNARSVMDREYRALIVIINSLAVTSADSYLYADLISSLDRNISYVRQHAMSKAAAADDDAGDADTGAPATDGTPVEGE